MKPEFHKVWLTILIASLSQVTQLTASEIISLENDLKSSSQLVIAILRANPQLKIT